MMDDGVCRVSRHVDHAHVGPQSREAFRHIPPARLRKDDVAKQEMDRPRVPLGDPKRLLSIATREDRETAIDEGDLDDLPDHLLVFHDQDRLGTPWQLGARWLLHSLLHRFENTREVDLERRSLSRLAVHPDVAAALLHDSEDHGEAEAGPLAAFLRGEERLEEMLPGFLAHP